MMAISGNVADEASPAEDTVLELYLAGDSPTSRRAVANLDAILARFSRRPTVRIVDVLGNPKTAFEKRIFATPSLISTSGGRSILILGNLSDQAAVFERLGGSLR